jgi:hypothetical protein
MATAMGFTEIYGQRRQVVTGNADTLIVTPDGATNGGTVCRTRILPSLSANLVFRKLVSGA